MRTGTGTEAPSSSPASSSALERLASGDCVEEIDDETRGSCSPDDAVLSSGDPFAPFGEVWVLFPYGRKDEDGEEEEVIGVDGVGVVDVRGIEGGGVGSPV